MLKEYIKGKGEICPNCKGKPDSLSTDLNRAGNEIVAEEYCDICHHQFVLTYNERSVKDECSKCGSDENDYSESNYSYLKSGEMVLITEHTCEECEHDWKNKWTLTKITDITK